jgi:hypothetical protein
MGQAVDWSLLAALTGMRWAAAALRCREKGMSTVSIWTALQALGKPSRAVARTASLQLLARQGDRPRPRSSGRLLGRQGKTG